MESLGNSPETVSLGQLKYLTSVSSNAEKNKTQITVNEKDGTIQTISHKNLSASGDAIKNNEDTSKILEVAAKMLRGDKLNQTDKPFKNTAKKTVNCYASQIQTKKMGKEEISSSKKELGNVFDNISGSLSMQSVSIAKAKANILDEGIKHWAEDHPVMSEANVKPIFLNIENDHGHSSDALDLFRHLMGGQVSIEDGGIDMFEINDTKMNNLSGELEEAEEAEVLSNRLGVLLNVFEDKASHGMNDLDKQALKDDIRNLTDTLKLQPSGSDSTVVIEKTMSNWRKGTPAQQNMARLLHTIHQSYHMDVMSSGTMGLLSKYDNSDCPHQLLNLKGLGMTMDKQAKPNGKDGRSIDIKFENDQVTVTHKVVLKQTGTPGGVTADQEAKLTANLNDLSQWNFNVNVQVNVPDNTDLANAQKINQIYKNAGIETKLNLS
ncbi:MAG: hypothetical protein H0V82_13135 [Candidatus Protochlamydia sp.]|nr:hypothetical protein [Candidatus Protochlamydia sp.]